ncbi:peptidoglycan DD-metalloendopeptidase family protein [Patescibacteria group bacterium]|nr:peptidoglycan DD-metalloendopeptidase family protein [Patescibacteria group bacterium]MBU1921985.1 peptidoglycan DD-metalloendopeptidase family protein [Patescibacteria group bacterium]
MKRLKAKARQVWYCVILTFAFGCYHAPEQNNDLGGDAYIRRLPFLPNIEVYVSQGVNDAAGTHNGRLSQAIDFSFPVSVWGAYGDRGLPIAAAEGGIIVEVVTGFADSSGSGFGNYILILYPDGRVGRYAHLREIFVRRGERVRQGQVIGTLGNSGFSTGPHLHYDEMNFGQSQTLPLNFFEAHGVPQAGRVYASRNTGPYDRAYWEHGGPTMLGEPSEEAGWFNPYIPCVDDDGDANFICDNENAYRNNLHILHLRGGSVGRGAIVYDALGGARTAVIIHGRMYDWWMTHSGPSSSLGAPIGMEYIDSQGDTRQDGDGGYLTWNESEVSFHSWQDNAAPGQTTASPCWDNAMSYLFVEAYSALGHEILAGEPKAQFGNPAQVHAWSGTRYLVQDFDGGSLNWLAIMYDPLNAEYGGENQAIALSGDFWEYYRAHHGITNFGAPISPAFVDSATGLERMDFESRLCLMARRGQVFQGSQAVSPSPDYFQNNGACLADIPDTDPDPEPEDLDNDGYMISDGDCDDGNPNVHPGSEENCGDSLDNDCDGSTDCSDSACHSFPACLAPTSDEVCDGADNDGDGLSDEDFTCRAGTHRDCAASCGTTGVQYCNASCDWDSCFAPDEICDHIDNNCDGRIDEGCESPPDPDDDALLIRFTAPAGFVGEIVYYDWSGLVSGGTYRAPWDERCARTSASSLECELEQAAGTFVEFNIVYGSTWACADWPAVSTGALEIMWRGTSYLAETEPNGHEGCNYKVTFL